MSLFKERGRVSKSDLRGALERTGVGGPISRQERTNLAKELSKKHGSQISRGEMRKEISELKRERFKTKDRQARSEIDRRIKLLEKI